MIYIGDRIRYYRKKKGLSQKQLCMKTGLSQPTLSDYENGKIYPKIDNLRKIADVLDVEYYNLLLSKDEIDEIVYNYS